MAQKKITDLTLRSDFDATVNLPGDDSSQTWRVTGQQVLDFIGYELEKLAPIAPLSKTANYTILATDGLVMCDSSGGTFALTFPTSPVAGQIVEVMKIDSSLTPITFVSGPSSGRLSTKGEYRKYLYSGSAWVLMEWNCHLGITAYTPTVTGVGTPTNINVVYSRNGHYLSVKGMIQTGTVASSDMTIDLPGSLAVDSDFMSSYRNLVGQWVRDDGAAAQTNIALVAVAGDTAIGAAGYISGGTAGSLSQVLIQHADVLVNSSEYGTFYFDVPIEGWEP